MPGEFVRVGKIGFPGKKRIRCSLFEWRSTKPEKEGKFKIRFISPDGYPQGSRRFWIEPLLELWICEKENRFIEQACLYGYKIVAKLDKHTDAHRSVYLAASHLFRNRNAGHTQIAREFLHAEDFVDFSDPSSPKLITPGIDSVATRLSPLSTTIHGKAKHLLLGAYSDLAALLQQPIQPTTPDFRGVVDIYERFALQPTKQKQWPLFEIDDTDSLFTRKMTPNLDFRKVSDQVASSLIYGPTILSEDFDAVAANPEAWNFLTMQLAKKTLQPNMTPEKFDKWLTSVRQRGYLPFVERGSKLTGEDRKAACALAQQMFRVHLWTAYRMMAHCYGTLMFLVYIAFCDSGAEKPSKQEELLFELRNCQWDFLAGLPLAFLGRAQLRWIWRFWERMEVRWTREDLPELYEQGQIHPDMYAVVPQLLGIFGGLVRERRVADRQTKARRGLPHVDTRDLETLGVEIADPRPGPSDSAVVPSQPKEALARLSSTDCPRCDTSLQVDEVEDTSDPANAVVSAYCKKCDTVTRFLVDLSKIAPADS